MEEIGTVELRHLNDNDYEALKATMIKAYVNWQSSYWGEEHIHKLLRTFPKGQLAILIDDEIVGCALSIIVKYDLFGNKHTYKQITGNYTFDTHTPKGDVLYGIDVFIIPEYRGLRLGRRLYDARKELAEQLNLRAIIFGGRIPNFHKYPDLSPKEYLEKVKHKEIHDPILNFQLANDFHVISVLRNYLQDDKESRGYAVLLGWDNIYYEKPSRKVSMNKSVVRLGLIQWQMRLYDGIEELFNHVEFFVDAVAGYKSDFALFPEFFNAPLMAEYNHLSESAAIRKLAEYTEEIRERFVNLAVQYNVNIITGSMPELDEDGRLFNVGFLCRRNGTFEKYTKIHVTPDEEKAWGLSGGSEVKVLHTDCGPIGVLICYDVEFPELPRLLSQEEMGILFVPFLTDTQNGYSRVRYCARARAIENECYVAIAGSVGNLPKVENMDIQFAQSVVFTPCDFPFPTTGIKAEATPNTEMILVADVDLDLLRELHEFGAVRNLKDRRTDVYTLFLNKKAEEN